jgi:hypothetical protein
MVTRDCTRALSSHNALCARGLGPWLSPERAGGSRGSRIADVVPVYGRYRGVAPDVEVDLRVDDIVTVCEGRDLGHVLAAIRQQAQRTGAAIRAAAQ